jgi:hypothetical protein
LAFVFAGTVLMGLAEIAGNDGTINGAHDLTETDGVGRRSKDVSAAHAAFGLHDTGALERQQNLFQIRLRKTSAQGDIANGRGGGSSAVQRQ